MVIWPVVGGLISAIAVSSVDLPAPLGPSEHSDDLATRDMHRDIPDGHNFGVAAAIDFAEVRDLDRRRGVVGRGVHVARTVLGSTRSAFQMPSRLASVEMTMTMRARLARSDGSISTRRGKCGNAYWPIHHANA